MSQLALLVAPFWTGGSPPSLEDETQKQREQLQLLVSAFSNSQQDQYEIYRRSTFQKSAIRRIMQNVCGGSVPQNAVIAMAGITKVCVGYINQRTRFMLTTLYLTGVCGGNCGGSMHC